MKKILNGFPENTRIQMREILELTANFPKEEKQTQIKDVQKSLKRFCRFSSDLSLVSKNELALFLEPTVFYQCLELAYQQNNKPVF